jgi:hypothetical protein
MAKKTIALKGSPIVNEEDAALAAITPGHLLEYAAGGVQKHSVAADNATPMFALERDELGDEIDVAYAEDDVVKVGVFHTGQRVYAFIASGQNIARGDYMESAGDGTLRVLTTDAATDDTQRVSVVAQAIEAVDNSAGPGDARIRVQVR